MRHVPERVTRPVFATGLLAITRRIAAVNRVAILIEVSTPQSLQKSRSTFRKSPYRYTNRQSWVASPQSAVLSLGRPSESAVGRNRSPISSAEWRGNPLRPG